MAFELHKYDRSKITINIKNCKYEDSTLQNLIIVPIKIASNKTNHSNAVKTI